MLVLVGGLVVVVVELLVWPMMPMKIGSTSVPLARPSSSSSPPSTRL